MLHPRQHRWYIEANAIVVHETLNYRVLLTDPDRHAIGVRVPLDIVQCLENRFIQGHANFGPHRESANFRFYLQPGGPRETPAGRL